MEPGHEDREDRVITAMVLRVLKPQWSPATKTGKTRLAGARMVLCSEMPQWSPATKTGKTARTNDSR